MAKKKAGVPPHCSKAGELLATTKSSKAGTDLNHCRWKSKPKPKAKAKAKAKATHEHDHSHDDFDDHSHVSVDSPSPKPASKPKKAPRKPYTKKLKGDALDDFMRSLAEKKQYQDFRWYMKDIYDASDSKIKDRWQALKQMLANAEKREKDQADLAKLEKQAKLLEKQNATLKWKRQKEENTKKKKELAVAQKKKQVEEMKAKKQIKLKKIPKKSKQPQVADIF